MEQKWLKFILAVVLCFTTVINDTAAKSEGMEVVRIATGEQPPLTSKTSKHLGYLNHIIEVAFKQQNKHVEFVFFPWSRAYLEAADGDIVATSYWFSDAKHQQHFYASSPLIRERVVFFRKKSAQKLETLADIKQLKLRIGLTRGYTYTKELWQYARKRPRLVSVVNTELQNFRMLLLGRIDVFPAEEVSGWYALNQHFSAEQVKRVETLDKELLEREAHLMFSKVHPDGLRLLKAFNKGLNAAKSAGLLDRLEEDFITGKYSRSLQANDLNQRNDFNKLNAH